MKANYLQRNKSRNPYLKWVLILIAIFTFSAFAFSLFQPLIISLVAPIWQTENVVMRGLRNYIAFYNNHETLVEENIMLREKVLSLQAELVSVQTGQVLDTTSIRASVLIHPPQTPYDFLIIDLGEADSIRIDSEVFLPDGSALGVISEVFAKQARVKLYSTAGEETNVVLERGSVPAVLAGIGGGTFKLIVQRSVEVKVGDRILTPYTDARLIAVVEEVSVGSTDSFQEVLARTPANIFNLRHIFVTP